MPPSADHTETQARGASALLRLLPTLVAVLGTAATFAVAQGLIPSRYSTLLLERGWTQPATVALFFWGLGHVIRQVVVQGGERRALRACRVAFARDPVGPDAVGPMMRQLAGYQHTLAGSVATAVLSYFRTHRPTRDEVVDVAHKAMDQARDEVELDYRPLNAVMWLLPLSGFVGTVIGMSAAIASFDGVIAHLSDDLSALAPSVQGLATAFDTTLLALVLVIPLKVLEVALDGRDQRLLSRIDDALGTGYVQRLDLAGIAQQSPLEAVLDRYADRVERIERAVDTIDGVVSDIAGTLGSMPEFTRALSEMTLAARTTQQLLPAMLTELEYLRSQGDAPMTLTRAPQRPRMPPADGPPRPTPPAGSPAHDTVQERSLDPTLPRQRREGGW